MLDTTSLRSVSIADACAACHAPRTGAYCATCGQRHLVGRLTVQGVLTRLATEAFNLDRGLLHTAVALARRVGRGRPPTCAIADLSCPGSPP